MAALAGSNRPSALPAPSQARYYKTTLTAANYVFEVDERYQDLRPIGAGSYGIVCSATDTEQLTGAKVAIKKVGDTFADLVDAKRILRELKLLRHFGGHENVIRISDIMTLPPGTIDFTDIYIVTELMESDLDRIISSSQPLTDAHYQYFLYQVLRGMKYIHSANVLHRDLKPSNLLVNANCDLAICDFGLARGVELESEEPMTEYVVTRWYRSPELLCDNQNYGPGVDVWAAGCIFAEMLSRRAFFQGADPRSQLETIVRKLGSPTEAELEFVDSSEVRDVLRSFPPSPKVSLFEYFPDSNPDAVDLLERMLTFSDRDRITVDEALQHPYLALLHDQSDEPVAAEVFNFDFEREALETGDDIPKAELQALMFSEMLHFRAASLSPGPNVPSPLAAPSPIQFPDEEFEDVGTPTPRRRHGFQ